MKTVLTYFLSILFLYLYLLYIYLFQLIINSDLVISILKYFRL